MILGKKNGKYFFLDDKKSEIETDKKIDINKKKSGKPDQSDTKHKEKKGILFLNKMHFFAYCIYLLYCTTGIGMGIIGRSVNKGNES